MMETDGPSVKCPNGQRWTGPRSSWHHRCAAGRAAEDGPAPDSARGFVAILVVGSREWSIVRWVVERLVVHDRGSTVVCKAAQVVQPLVADRWGSGLSMRLIPGR